MILRAPAKLNLCLYVGPARPGGRHEICSLFQPISLSDRLTVGEAAADEVVCKGVAEPNLAAAALAALRARGWRGPPLRIEIEKRIPLGGGLGGGSADAAAVLRLARDQLGDLGAVAAELGADVPSQLDPGLCLVGGAGESVEPLPRPGEYAIALIPAAEGLSTAAVYAEADRLGPGRAPAELEAARAALRGAAVEGASPLAYLDLLVNDLQPAAISLRPQIAGALAALSDAGAALAAVTGSGPTVFGLFASIAEADRATGALPPRYAGALVASPERFA